MTTRAGLSLVYTCALCGHTVTFQQGPQVDGTYIEDWVRDHERIQHGDDVPAGRRDWP